MYFNYKDTKEIFKEIYNKIFTAVLNFDQHDSKPSEIYKNHFLTYFIWEARKTAITNN